MSRALVALFPMPRGEARRALSMFASFLLVITSFWIQKPLRKGLFIEHYDHGGLSIGALQLGAAQAELCAKLLQVALAIVVAFACGRVARTYRRRTLLASVTGGFALALAGFGTAATHKSTAFVWLLYSCGDLYGTLMVAVLFACLNDLATPESVRRSYGLVGLGAVLGGVIGSQGVCLLLGALSLRAWLFVCSALTLAAAAFALHATSPLPADASSVTPHGPAPSRERGDHAFALSPYLLSLALLVGLYEVISTLLDYQFTATLAHTLDGPAIGRQMGRAFSLMNVTALGAQLFLTTPLLRRHGPSVALLCLPLTLLFASAGMLFVPSLTMASLVPSLDGGIAYSVHQSAKEGLYVPLPGDAKYGAKAFIDVFVLRSAKAIGLLLSLVIAAVAGDAAGLRDASRLTLALVLPFALAALYAGKRAQLLAASRVAMRRSVLP